jgi:hypothetical protein
MDDSGFKRVEELERELARIREKLKKGREHGGNDGTIRALEEQVAALGRAIAAAILEEARREIKATEDEADRLKNGQPPKPAPAGPGPGNPGGGGSPGGGPTPGGGGGGGGGGAKPDPDSIGDGGRSTVPEPVTVYVQSERAVWAWSRPAQSWLAHHFNSKVVKVKLITGGILAIAEHSAVLFDTKTGQWLAPFDAASETLTDGDAQ